MVVPAVSDEPRFTSWVASLHPALYPPGRAYRLPAVPTGCPPFRSNDTVSYRPGRANVHEGHGLRPGEHKPRVGRHRVVWWDPALLEAAPEAGARPSVRRYELLQEPPGRSGPAAGDAALEEWLARRERTLADGSTPRLRPLAVTERAATAVPELEAAAERLWEQAGLARGDVDRHLVEHLQAAHDVRVDVVPSGQAAGLVRRYDPQVRRLQLSEVLAPRSRSFQLAHQIALLGCRQEIERLVAGGQLTTPDSQALARVALANAFAGAVLMPYGRFLAAAREVRYDIELLGHRFRTSFEQVCHRLTTLQRPGEWGVPFHFIRVDIAGNISKRFSASGIRFARYGGSCPRWNVHAAFLAPGFIRTQVSRMPDGTRYFCIARTVRKEGGGFHVPQSRLAIGLGCEIGHARELVYADGYDLGNEDADVPIGTTCRLCERTDCRQRAFPPLQHPFTVDENVRGLSFYAPGGDWPDGPPGAPNAPDRMS